MLFVHHYIVDCYSIIFMASMSRTSSSCASAYMGVTSSMPVGLSSSLGESTASEHEPQISTFRGKVDPAWSHCELISQKDGKKSVKCNYCGKILSGGGIYRMKLHLSKKKGEVAACKKVPPEVEYEIKMSLESIFTDKNKKRKISEVDQVEGGEKEVEEINAAHFGTGTTSSSIARRGNIGSYFPPSTTAGAQPSIKSVMAGKRTLEMVDKVVGKFFYHACIPFNAVNSTYFQEMIDAIGHVGPGYKAPSYHALRGKILNEIGRAHV